MPPRVPHPELRHYSKWAASTDLQSGLLNHTAAIWSGHLSITWPQAHSHPGPSEGLERQSDAREMGRELVSNRSGRSEWVVALEGETERPREARGRGGVLNRFTPATSETRLPQCHKKRARWVRLQAGRTHPQSFGAQKNRTRGRQRGLALTELARQTPIRPPCQHADPDPKHRSYLGCLGSIMLDPRSEDDSENKRD